MGYVPVLRLDTGGTRFVLALYLVTLGLGLALVPPTPMPALQTEPVRGVAMVGAGLLLLRVGAFPRGRTYVVQHLLVALVTAWGVVVFASAQNWVAMALMVITTTTLVALPFAAPASSLTRDDGTTAPHLLALALGGIAAAWGGLHLLDEQGTTAMLRGYGLDPEPYWWLAAATGFEVVAQELLPVPVRWRWAAQVACGAVCLSYALMLPLRVPSAYWLLNAATIVRSVALLALPVLRGCTLLETSAYADRLTTALILAAVSPLAIVVTSVMWLIDDSAVAAAERNAILGATLLAAALFSLAARVQAGALTGELRRSASASRAARLGGAGRSLGRGRGASCARWRSAWRRCSISWTSARRSARRCCSGCARRTPRSRRRTLRRMSFSTSSPTSCGRRSRSSRRTRGCSASAVRGCRASRSTRRSWTCPRRATGWRGSWTISSRWRGRSRDWAWTCSRCASSRWCATR